MTKAQVSAPSSPLLRLGARLSVLGALGLVVTNIFYGLAGLAPTQSFLHPYNLKSAVAGSIAAAGYMKAAGAIGIGGDLVWGAAALLLGQAYGRLGKGLASLGWNTLFLAVILFVFVDGMTGFVLPQLAASHNVLAFEGFRRLWDVLFFLCVIAFGAALLTIAVDHWRSVRALYSRLHSAMMLLVGIVGITTSAVGFAEILMGNLAAYAVPGTSIGVGAALLIPLSIQIGRQDNTSLSEQPNR